MKKIPYFLFVFIAFIRIDLILTAQTEEDSLVAELGSLLDSNVEEEKFVSSASKYDQSPE